MKKILYIGNFSFPNGNSSGSRVLGNGYLLKNLGYEVFYIGLDKSLSDKSNIKETKKSYDGFKYYNLPYPIGIKGWLSYKKRFKEVVALIDKEDLYAIIIYGSTTISLFGRLIRQWCRKNRVKFITDVVDWLSAGYGSFLYRLVKYIDTFYQKRILNSSADGVIVVSSFLNDYYKKKKCKTVIVPPLVNTKKFELFNEIKTNKSIKLIYVGQPFPTDGRIVKEISYKDRLDKAIDLLFRLRDMNFIFNIYGLTKEQYLSVISDQRSKIEELKNKIKFHGYIENNKAIKKVAESDFTVLLRDVNRMTTAGFPTKFVESISCGTPIITTKTSDLEEYVKVGKNGFFIDLSNIEGSIDYMRKILTTKNDTILEMKKYCFESGIFYYENYVEKIKKFMDLIEANE
jgi:glycosyltransferase involved in cell wall biosynthesis